MSAKDEIQKNFEEEMKFKEHYIETASGKVYNAITELTALCKAIIVYLDNHNCKTNAL